MTALSDHGLLPTGLNVGTPGGDYARDDAARTSFCSLRSNNDVQANELPADRDAVAKRLRGVVLQRHWSSPRTGIGDAPG